MSNLYFSGRAFIHPEPVVTAANSHGYAFFCKNCGDVWEKLVSDFRDHENRPFYHVKFRTCPQHGGKDLLLPLELVLDPQTKIPREALCRDFLTLSNLWLEYGRITHVFYLP